MMLTGAMVPVAAVAALAVVWIIILYFSRYFGSE